MKCKCVLLLNLALLPYIVFAQVNNNIFNGIVVTKNKAPIDVFSIVIFNTLDSTKQLYANTFSNGSFSFNFEKKKDHKYGVYLLSVGYEDRYINLDELKDTVILSKKSMQINDVVVQGKRDVKTEMGTYGGLAYDVSNTFLSGMTTSTQMLNFIPGVKVSDLGDIELLGSSGDVVVYINNIKMTDKQKLLSLKSEDIKSVEVINSPGARFKGAKAVLYIKTNRALDGFSSRISNRYMAGDRMSYEAPSAEMSFTKNKITISGAYRYTYHDYFKSYYNTRKIDENVYPGEWQISDKSDYYSTSNTHWYSANINYAINSKNTLVAEYTGSAYNDVLNNTSNQPVSTRNQGIIYNNTIKQGNTPKKNTNRAHIGYKGDYSEKFNVTADIDFSNRSSKDFYDNDWLIDDILTGEKTNTNFKQNERSNAAALTTEILFNHKIKDKHEITYGAEYSFLRDDVISSTNNNTANSSYYLNSHFIKLITEYTLYIGDFTNTTIGLNYMYSKLMNNNSNNKGFNYNNIKPFLSVQYYNPIKKIGINFSATYDDYQPTAGDLNDITTTIISPYEVSRGNKNMINTKCINSSVSFSYKTLNIGVYQQTIFNSATGTTIVEDNNGKPLFVNTTMYFKKPFNDVTLYGSYLKQIGFWTPRINASVVYSTCKVEQADNVFEKAAGFRGQFYLNNQFKLPLNFYIYLDCYYKTRGYMYVMLLEPTYNLDLSIEKRFFKDNLTISIKGSGIIKEKHIATHDKMYGVYNQSITNGYGTRRCFSINASWRFNNHKKVQQAKDNEYLNML